MPVRSAATTCEIARASSPAPPSSMKAGAAKGKGSITPSVMVILSGPCCAATGAGVSAAASAVSAAVMQSVRIMVGNPLSWA